MIPTRDRPPLLRRAVDSALAQIFTAIEVVVVDDASRPPVNLADADDRLRVVRLEAGRGPCAARNEGLRSARGRLITFLDDDDVMLPNMLELVVAAISSSLLPPPVAAACGLAELDAYGNQTAIDLPVDIPRGSSFFEADRPKRYPRNALVAPTDVLREIGGFDEDQPHREHTDVYVRLCRVASVQAVHEVTYHLLGHAGPRLSDGWKHEVAGIRRLLRKHRVELKQHSDYELYLLRALARAYRDGGRSLLAGYARLRRRLLSTRRRLGR